MPHVFWDLNPVDGVVTKIDGETITAVDINDLPTVYPDFSIVKDDTDIDTLIYNGANAVSLEVNDIVFVPSWFGGIPIKRPK